MTRQQIIEFLGNGPRRIHFVGIGGVGMSGLAKILVEQGHFITGCDASPNGETTRLRQMGVRIQVGHCASHIKEDTELVIHTSAVHGSHSELTAAVEADVPVIRRGALLSALLNHQNNIAVAGTHGKTTTSAMIAQILSRSDSAPSYCIGAHIPCLGTNAQNGAGRHFVVEACESDGTLIHFTPDYAVCLNIEAEHLDHHKSMDRLMTTFDVFLMSTLRTVFYCADCANCIKLATKQRSAISFGLSAAADYRAINIQPTRFGSTFTVTCRGVDICQVELVIPGVQNVVNALAAFAVTDELGLPAELIAGALRTFTGARRRFERKLEAHGLVVADDYAHHPTEIRATIKAAHTLGFKRLLLAFQPHRYTRTRDLAEQFGSAFRGVDRLFLTDIYSAGERPVPGITGQTLVDRVKATGHVPVDYEPDLEKLADRLAAAARPGDLILTMGAGNIYQVADALKQRLNGADRPPALGGKELMTTETNLQSIVSRHTRIKRNESMAKHTSLRVGGPAEFWVEPHDEHDLARVLHFAHSREIPVTIVGRGTNLLVRDGGIEGFVIHLDGHEFNKAEVTDDRIIARAGARLKTVVNLARKHGLGGLEFLEGIPGSVGGALRMNAGAMGRQTFDVLSKVRYVSFSGEIYEAEAKTLPVNYRNCPVFASHVALEAIFCGEKTERTLIEKTLRLFEKKRWSSQPAKPSAGCIFKNPSTIPAGKLIDELGLKGTRVGKAEVSDVHGNFIVTANGATAADVLALIEKVRERARQERGIELETEVQILGREKSSSSSSSSSIFSER